MGLIRNLGHRNTTEEKLVLPASGSQLKADTWATLRDHLIQSDAKPSSDSPWPQPPLCNHVNYSKPREKLTRVKKQTTKTKTKQKHLLICSYFWVPELIQWLGHGRFRFESNVWAGYSLPSEPRHVNEQGLHYDASVSGTQYSYLLNLCTMIAKR